MTIAIGSRVRVCSDSAVGRFAGATGLVDAIEPDCRALDGQTGYRIHFDAPAFGWLTGASFRGEELEVLP